MIRLLVIGRHEEIHQTLLRLINQHEGWEATGATSDEEAIALFQEQTYDLVLLGGGIEEASEQKLRLTFQAIDPACAIVQHYGGGSGLLTGEILQSLELKKRQ